MVSKSYVPKVPLGIALGLLGVMLLWITASSSSIGSRQVLVPQAAWCLGCQLFLSRKNADAYREDWASMLALNAPLLLLFLVDVVVGLARALLSGDSILVRGQGDVALLLVAACGATYTGAVLASLLART
jgi:hypothetical protein